MGSRIHVSLVVATMAAVLAASLAVPAQAAVSNAEIKSALVTLAEAKKLSKTTVDLVPDGGGCGKTDAGVPACMHYWSRADIFAEPDGSVYPKVVLLRVFPNSAGAAREFSDNASEYERKPGTDVVEHSKSRMIFGSVVGNEYLASGFQATGKTSIQVSCFAGRAVPSAAVGCARKLLAAQVAKSARLR